jgi:hypothetical protein
MKTYEGPIKIENWVYVSFPCYWQIHIIRPSHFPYMQNKAEFTDSQSHLLQAISVLSYNLWEGRMVGLLLVLLSLCAADCY